MTVRHAALQAEFLDKSRTIKNPHYKPGVLEGWTTIGKSGDMIVPYEKIGELGKTIGKQLEPLRDGPFGEAPLPPTRRPRSCPRLSIKSTETRSTCKHLQMSTRS